jgi:hypothetical protein
MTKIIVSLAAVALLGTMCIATVSDRSAAIAAAQAEGYSIDASVIGMMKPADDKFASLISP